jgi:acid stress-induced BolA-like protein IbaG/YrbA
MSNILDEIRSSIHEEIDGADVRVEGNGGHFAIEVVSDQFEGKNMIQKHRMVLRSIKHLMEGASAPVHAIDTLRTLTPDEAE